MSGACEQQSQSKLMNVYCYYQPLNACGDRHREVEAWCHNWRGRGFTPVVLDQTIAERHPQWDCLKNRKSLEFPSINPDGYDFACWARWLALDVMGGGLMVDYDVGNRDLKPDEVILGYPVILEPQRVPCAVATNDRGATLIADTIMSHQAKPRGNHYSDMFFFQDSNFPNLKVCVELGHPGWETAKLIHFATGACHKYGGNKLNYIQSL